MAAASDRESKPEENLPLWKARSPDEQGPDQERLGRKRDRCTKQHEISNWTICGIIFVPKGFLLVDDGHL